MLIVDSQVHIWDNAKPGGHHRQVTKFTQDDLLKEMDEAGVDAAVLCPRAAGPESGNQVSIDAARQHPDRFAVMGWFRLDDPANRERIKTWKQIPGMYGLRWAMNQPEQKTWWTDGTMDWLWPAAEREGIPLGFIAGEHLATIGRVAERHPALRLIVDHLGRVGRKTDDEAFANLADLLALAKYPNVAVKLSGTPSYSSEAYPFRNIHPYLRRMFDAFGPSRMFWGTDITRLSCSYRQCVTMFTEELPWLAGRDLELVMGQALCEWIGWHPKKAEA